MEPDTPQARLAQALPMLAEHWRRYAAAKPGPFEEPEDDEAEQLWRIYHWSVQGVAWATGLGWHAVHRAVTEAELVPGWQAEVFRGR